jgi:hypothetical protein
VTYQPASRYWAVQWYETAIFLGLAVILAGICFWQIRRRRSEELHIPHLHANQKTPGTAEVQVIPDNTGEVATEDAKRVGARSLRRGWHHRGK